MRSLTELGEPKHPSIATITPGGSDAARSRNGAWRPTWSTTRRGRGDLTWNLRDTEGMTLNLSNTFHGCKNESDRCDKIDLCGIWHTVSWKKNKC